MSAPAGGVLDSLKSRRCGERYPNAISPPGGAADPAIRREAMWREATREPQQKYTQPLADLGYAAG